MVERRRKFGCTRVRQHRRESRTKRIERPIDDRTVRVHPALVESDLVVTVGAAETVSHGGAAALVIPLLGVRQLYRTTLELTKVTEELLDLMVAAIEARKRAGVNRLVGCGRSGPGHWPPRSGSTRWCTGRSPPTTPRTWSRIAAARGPG